jgi:4-amino-4-deoxy-L-arabinose transferase-like glycosyltransferase
VAGLVAGVAFALTPVAVLMFRFNNPDALLVLLLVLAAYCVTRAIERASTRWLVLAGVAIGFGVLTKMGAALLVLPGLALAYLVGAPTGWWRRVRQLLAGGVALVVSAGWYLALVALWPAADRPYIGGSQTNSLLELALGYNGISRLLGRSHGSGGGAFGPGGGPGGGHFGGFGGAAGWSRLFAPAVGGQASWLLPAALVVLPVGLWLTRRAPRTDPVRECLVDLCRASGDPGVVSQGRAFFGVADPGVGSAATTTPRGGSWAPRSRLEIHQTLPRAALLLWGGWLLVTGLVFSYMAGIFHPYYTVALAPAVAAVLGIGGRELLGRRPAESAGSARTTARTTLPVRITLAVLVAGTGAWAWVLLDRTPTWLPALRWAVLAVTAVATLAVLVAGHRAAGSSPEGDHGVARWAVALAVLAGLLGPAAYSVQTALTPHTSGLASAGPATGEFDGGRFGGSGNAGGDRARGGHDGGRGAHAGGPDEDAEADAGATALLRAAGTTWSAATISSHGASSLELSSDTAVMAIGGFMGSDPAPTLAQFQADVAAGRIHYFVAEAPRGGAGHGTPAGGAPDGGRGGRDSRGTANQISTWVSGHFAPITVAGQTWYDLTRPLH